LLQFGVLLFKFSSLGFVCLLKAAIPGFIVFLKLSVLGIFYCTLLLELACVFLLTFSERPLRRSILCSPFL
jgi:hypothetical protein